MIRRALLSSFFKLGLLCCLGFYLAQPELLEEKANAKSLPILVDASASMLPEQLDALLQHTKKLPDYEFQYVLFAGDLALRGISAQNILTGQEILQKAQSLHPGESRIVSNLFRFIEQENPAQVFLFSDGRLHKETESLGESEGLRFDVPIFPLFPPEIPRGDLEISQLSVPKTARAEESVDIRTSIRNRGKDTQRGTLRVYQGDKLLRTEQVEIAPGRESLVLVKSDPNKDGLQLIRSELEMLDGKSQKREKRAYLSTERRARILLLSGTRNDEQFLLQALQDLQFTIDNKIAGQDKFDTGLQNVRSLILNNVSLADIPGSLLGKIRDYVYGGGRLVLVGGNKAFGLGKYQGSILDEISPLKSLPPKAEKKRVNVAVTLVIDKSGSMRENNKIEYAKEAAREVVRNLRPEDYISVIGFDLVPFIAVPMWLVGEKREDAMTRIGRLFPAHETMLYPALEEARRGMTNAPAGRKHIIVLTDGKIRDAGPHYMELTSRLRGTGITVSTVMLGAESDTYMLKRMADVGGGAFYQTSNAQNLPRIFLSDIHVSTGERAKSEQSQFQAIRQDVSEPITSAGDFPPLRGLVETELKNGASQELFTRTDDGGLPLLAHWKKGDGQAVAFASDASGRWSSFWTRWGGFRRFWAEIVEGKTQGRDDAAREMEFDFQHSFEAGTLKINLAVFSKQAREHLRMTVKKPDNKEIPVTLQENATGLFEAQIPVDSPGAYFFDMQSRSGDFAPVGIWLEGELFGETPDGKVDKDFLNLLAQQSGGAINPKLERLAGISERQVHKKSLDWLALLGMLLFLLGDIYYRERT